jgi:two-component system chemotaxis sensor kinase CheA
VRLSAQHAGGSVVVSLSDDGRGLDRERIARKAVEKGLIESDRGMTDAEVYALIFAPGFSTAETLTDVSGRGVGMDVVKRNIDKVRGRIEIASVLGQGTTFTVRLPLTLAVTDGMLVRVGSERYVVPTTNIHMSFRPEPGMLHTVGGRGEVVTLRGEVMPVVRLHALFGIADAERDPARAILMLVGDGERKTALLVDELLGQHQVVVKTLGDGVGRVPGVAGGAILGDGRVGLIVDVGEIVALAERGEALLAAA